MSDAMKERLRQGDDRGFTLIEVLVSILITLIVMGAVFGLLTRGQRSFQREPEIADLQQSARSALDMVAKDILQAGAGLPPEFPAFSRINGAGDNAPTDVLEIIGAFQSAGNVYLEPEPVMSIDPGVGLVTMEAMTTNLEPDDMVVLYNDIPNDVAPFAHWILAQVDAVDETGPNAIVTLDYGAYDPAYSSNYNGKPANPDPAQFPYNLNLGQVPKISRVAVVRYFTQPDDPAKYNGPPPEVLMRDRNFAGAPQAVGYLEDFQIRYVIGVTAPIEQDMPPHPVDDLGQGTQLTAENMLSSVRVSVTARSISAGMEGASQGASAGREDDFIRKTFSTNVNPRNVSAGLDSRAMAAAGGNP